MAEVTAALVKELREMSGAGMMECKKALVAANGDINQAMDDMRKAGQAKADKKSGRTAAEGVVTIETSADHKRVVMIEVNSETDFVARDTNFMGFVKELGLNVLKSSVSSFEEFSSVSLSNGESIELARQNLITKIGENVNIRRAKIIDTHGVIGSYVHSNRIGVIVDLEGGDANLAKDIAMHIAAASPMVISPSEIPQEIVDKEKEIFLAQAEGSGKPKEIIEKMTEGRIRKFLEEVSLVGQAFVKNPEQKVGDLLKAHKASVKSFVRFEVGEGIEKVTVDFVKEVMEQAKA